MIGFYLEVRTMMQGRQIELVVYRGSQLDRGNRLGSLHFEPDEWEAFRPVVIGGMRVAGYAHIPIELMDQTRQRPHSVH